MIHALRWENTKHNMQSTPYEFSIETFKKEMLYGL
jgi:hypothetical protein